MVASNMAQLEKMLMQRLNSAMTVASEQMLADMYKETGSFYTAGKPKKYKRTGALGDSPRTTALTQMRNGISFWAYLDDGHDYTTGTFTMGQVLQRAESTHFRSGILGRPKFWQRTQKRFERTFRSTMKKFFK